MGNAKIRRSDGSDGSGSIKLKRNLNISWELEEITSSVSIMGEDGEIEKAIVFGDDTSLTKDKITLNETSFSYFRREGSILLTSSADRLYKIVDGPFFKSRDKKQDSIGLLTSLGAWVPNLPREEQLIIQVNRLASDGVYEIRCIFSDGKNQGSKNISINSEESLDMSFSSNIVLKGQFIAPKESIKLGIKSNDEFPPFINAIVLRRLGHAPRAKIKFKI